MQRLVGLAALVVAMSVGAAEAKPALSSREFGGLKKEAQRALHAEDFATAARKVRELGQDDSKRAIDALCSLVAAAPQKVYDAAATAISEMESEEAKAHLLGKLEASGGKVTQKMLLVDAMAKRADAFAGKALGAALGSRQKQVQRAAVAAVKQHKLLGAMDGLIGLLAKVEKKAPDGLVAALVHETLYHLTGESFETAEDWNKFWEPRRDNFAAPGEGAPRKPMETARRKTKRPTFFGSELKSNRLVFVIDVSGSMQQADPPMGSDPAPGSRVRIDRAKAQLKQAVENLPSDARFTILAYSAPMMVRGPNGPQLPPGTPPQGPLPPKVGSFEWLRTWKPKLQSVSKKSKASAIQFVDQLKAEGGTFTLNAIQAALAVDGADTIVVLSDGMPNDFDRVKNSQLNAQQILDQIATLNRFKRRVIDTFGFDGTPGAGGGLAGGFRPGQGGGAPPAGHPRGGGAGGGMGGLGQFMQDLAAQNSGKYTPIQ